MLTELLGKGGCLCQPAREGHLRCPLIVRPTSEDVITGHLVQTLRILNPRQWLSDLLNAALGARRFRRQVYRKLRIDPWVNKPTYPRELLPWDEGSTQVDVCITWENPPTTVYIEAKYGSPLSERTARNQGQYGYPADQLIRNARVGLWESGYLDSERLFEARPRDFILLLLAPERGQPLVQQYRVPEKLRTSLPHGERFRFPRTPFIGEIGYAEIRQVFQDRKRWFTRTERQLISDLDEYLQFKHAYRPSRGELARGSNSSLSGTRNLW